MSAGSMLGMLFNILIVGAFASITGWEIDKSNFAFQGMSADASNFIRMMMIAFGIAMMIIFMIACVINHFINEKSEANQNV